jgi:hypothetical protein
MSTNNLSNNDFSIVFEKVKQYNEANSLSENDFLQPEEIIENETIRDFGQICEELNDSTIETVIYQTFC